MAAVSKADSIKNKYGDLHVAEFNNFNGFVVGRNFEKIFEDDVAEINNVYLEDAFIVTVDTDHKDEDGFYIVKQETKEHKILAVASKTRIIYWDNDDEVVMISYIGERELMRLKIGFHPYIVRILSNSVSMMQENHMTNKQNVDRRLLKEMKRFISAVLNKR